MQSVRDGAVVSAYGSRALPCAADSLRVQAAAVPQMLSFLAPAGCPSRTGLSESRVCLRLQTARRLWRAPYPILVYTQGCGLFHHCLQHGWAPITSHSTFPLRQAAPPHPKPCNPSMLSQQVTLRYLAARHRACPLELATAAGWSCAAWPQVTWKLWACGPCLCIPASGCSPTFLSVCECLLVKAKLGCLHDHGMQVDAREVRFHSSCLRC